MNLIHTPSRIARPLALALTIALTLAAPAWASVASEQQQGAQIVNAIHAGKLSATSLQTSQYEHVGEYLMGQALGSTQAHEQMNSLMGQMMGAATSDQMHAYLGERYAGRNVQPTTRNAPLYGLIGMMMGYRNSPVASMMSGYLRGHSGGAGTYAVGSGMMGSGTQSSQGATGSWPTGAIVATGVLAALLLGGTLGLAVSMRRKRDRRVTPAPI